LWTPRIYPPAYGAAVANAVLEIAASAPVGGLADVVECSTVSPECTDRELFCQMLEAADADMCDDVGCSAAALLARKSLPHWLVNVSFVFAFCFYGVMLLFMS